MPFHLLSEISQKRAIEEYIKENLWRNLKKTAHINRDVVRNILKTRDTLYDEWGRIL